RHGAEHNRVLATVLFTDVVKSTEHAATLGDRRWRELLERHHAMVRRESSTVKDLVAGSGLRFRERGAHELKGVPGPWQLYSLERD
ncbi:MAG TPA: hypothetical protein VJX71_23415, partial [Methylomirabilota bacterium]|nr:hypothetical protein [Methylomirabilota bacterium]